MAIRIQRQRQRGWKAPDGAIFVGRPTIWGNPFRPDLPSGVFPEGRGHRGMAETLIPAMTLDQCVEFYRELVIGCIRPEMYPHGHAWMKRFKEKTRNAHPLEWARSTLRGKDLICWCPLGQACHATVLLEVANC